MNRIFAAVALAFVVGCGGTDSSGTGEPPPPPPPPPPPALTCSLGSLPGLWRAHLSETNGTCGALSDMTGVPGNIPTDCTLAGRQFSPDRCHEDYAMTCPTLDGQGTTTWAVSLNQVSDTQVSGSGTMQIVHPTLGACRSTYDITATRL